MDPTAEKSILRLACGLFVNEEHKITEPHDGADGEGLHVTVTNANGDTVAEGFGNVKSMTRRERSPSARKGDPPGAATTERVYAASVS